MELECLYVVALLCFFRHLWLFYEENRNEIEKVFNITNFHINDFEIAESLEECICKYCSWFHYDQVHLINDVYVIKVIF